MKNIAVRSINTTSKNLDFSGNFSIRDVEILLAGNDLLQDLHRHDFFFILALKKGMGAHTIDFTSYKINDNSIFFMRPGQVHQLTLRSGSSGFLVQFKKDFYFPNENESKLLLRNASDKNLYQPDANQFNKLFSILKYMFEEFRDKKEGYYRVIKANLAIFLIEIVRHQQTDKNLNNSKTSFSHNRLDEFFDLLETYISKQKHVTQYAGMMNLSSYQLNAITKEALGKTCSELIDEHIILESKRHLLATTSQIKEIAWHLGYEDVSYFIRFFKKHTGVSPEIFRQNFS